MRPCRNAVLSVHTCLWSSVASGVCRVSCVCSVADYTVHSEGRGVVAHHTCNLFLFLIAGLHFERYDELLCSSERAWGEKGLQSTVFCLRRAVHMSDCSD